MNYTNQKFVKKPSSDIERAVEYKREGIAEAQKRKQNSMEMLACFRDATLMAVAEISKLDMKDFENDIEMVEKNIENIWEKWHAYLKSKLDSEILGF